MPAPPAADNAFSRKFTAPLLLGSTLNPINSSLIATGLVGIGVDFGRGPAATGALVSVLYLCSAVGQPTMGKLADVVGPRRVFVTGILILLAGGILGAAAPAFWLLLVSRGLIGIGTSAAYPTAMSLVRARADAAGIGVPGRVLGNFAIAAQVTIVVGLPLGGILTGAFGWRALFLINVPVALVTLVMTLRGVAPDPPRSRTGVVAAVDLPGIALFAGTVVALLLFLSGLSSPVWWLLAAVAGLGTALVLRELRASSPLVDVRMLAGNGALVRTYLRQTLAALGTYLGLYGVSQWLESAAGYSATQVGVILLPLSVASIVIARVTSGRGWVRAPLVLAGLAFAATGALLLGVTSATGVVVLLTVTLLFGVANGLNGFPNQAALYTQTSREQIAVASGLYRTCNYLGAIFSASLVGIAFGSHVDDAGLHVAAWALGGIGAGFALLAGLDRRVPLRTKQ